MCWLNCRDRRRDGPQRANWYGLLSVMFPIHEVWSWESGFILFMEDAVFQALCFRLLFWSMAPVRLFNSITPRVKFSSFVLSSRSPLVYSQACNPGTAGGLPLLHMGQTDFGCYHKPGLEALSSTCTRSVVCASCRGGQQCEDANLCAHLWNVYLGLMQTVTARAQEWCLRQIRQKEAK